MCRALKIFYVKKKNIFCMWYVTKLPGFGSKHPDLDISRLKLKQELFNSSSYCSIHLDLLTFLHDCSKHSPEVPFFLSARDI